MYPFITVFARFLFAQCGGIWVTITTHYIHLPTTDNAKQIPALYCCIETVSDDTLPNKYLTKDSWVLHHSLSNVDSVPATFCSRSPLPSCSVRMFNFSSRFMLLRCTDAAEQGSISKWLKVSLRSARRDYFCVCTGSRACTGTQRHTTLVLEHGPAWSQPTAGQFGRPGVAKV